MKRISLRIEEEDYNYLKSEAVKNELSVNAMIAKLIDDKRRGKDEFYKNIEGSLKNIASLVKEVKQVSTASVLIARETLKETCKSGFFSQSYISDDCTGGEEHEKQMLNYINKNDKQTVNILKEAHVL